MFLQGNLQAVFDALYTIGAIDPVLKMDWELLSKEMQQQPHIVHQACQVINACEGNMELLVNRLSTMEEQMIRYVAMEVAREFCESQESHTLH